MDGNLNKCAEYARKIADLGNTKQQINQSINQMIENPDQRSKGMDELVKLIKREDELLKLNNKLSKEYEQKIESICPRTGFECETFLSRPERNICRPFTIRNNDRFVLRNDTYR
jgi:hypothetical protein